MDACLEEDFVGIGVADGAQDRVVVQQHSDLFAAVPGGQAPECFLGEIIGEDVHALRVESRDVGGSARFGQVEFCHFLFIGEMERASVVEFDRGAPPPRGFLRLHLVVEASGEHQVQDKLLARGESEQEERSANAR